MKSFIYSIACSAVILLFASCNADSNKSGTNAKEHPDSVYAKLTDAEKRMPEHAIEGLEIAEGLNVSLFASEPMIGNPTNIDVDARGRVWVCEALNYRPTLNPNNPQRDAGDRILILEDNDGDGKADTAKVFYQGNDVNAALGIAVLGNKVIVSCSPNVFLFTDTDGDDKPDKKEVLFTHIGGEQHDHAIHSFIYGPDGRLYFTFGNEGQQLQDKNGKIIIDKNGNAVTGKGNPYRQGMVFRMNEDGSDLEVLGNNFRNNYEAAVDAFGTVWQSDNDDDGNQGTRINYVMEYGNYGYTDEMTGAGWRARRINMESEIPKKHWHQNDPGSIPNLLFTGAGSPAGICIYEGNLLPAAFRNQMIHAEAGNNVVRSYPVVKDGAGYKASIRPILTGKRDQWFRPVDVCTAPDGSLFVADWYDPGVGGHQMVDLNRGRIYRIAPSVKEYKISNSYLNTAEAAVEGLKNPNLATRYIAWKKLDSLGAAAEPALLKLWQSDNPRVRARALWLLGRIPDKGQSYLQQGLQDKNPDIRITAFRAARQLQTDIIPVAEQLAKDNDPQVRREVALALHNVKSPAGANIWADLAMQYDGNDRWYLEALGIGADGKWDTYLNAYIDKVGNEINSASAANIIWRARSESALPLLVQLIENSSSTDSARLKYFRAFDFVKSSRKNLMLAKLLDYKGPGQENVYINTLYQINADEPGVSASVKPVLKKILDSLKGSQVFVDLINKYKLKSYNQELLDITLAYPDSSLGRDAANLLISSGGASLLTKAIKGTNADTAQAAIKALSAAGTGESMKMLQTVIRDQSVSVDLRKQVVENLARGWNESGYLLTMLREGKIPKELRLPAAKALSLAYRKDIKQGALQFLPVSDSLSGKSLPPINELAKQNGNITLGQAVFKANCASCHKVGDDGENVGPALSKIGSKLTKEAIYIAILHPDEGISFGYEGYVFKMKDGDVQAGIITSETNDAVEIVMQGGVKKTLEKSSITSRSQMKNSLMPGNIYQTISQQELVDLVEFLYGKK